LKIKGALGLAQNIFYEIGVNEGSLCSQQVPASWW